MKKTIDNLSKKQKEKINDFLKDYLGKDSYKIYNKKDFFYESDSSEEIINQLKRDLEYECLQ